MVKNLILPLNEIIGIPIMDIVRAEAQAAQVSIEFIQNVGFRRTEREDADALGELRLVTFRYKSPDSSGKELTHEVKIPLLSLVPLPLLQIESSEIELVAKIVDTSQLDVDSVLIARKPTKNKAISEKHNEFLATVDNFNVSADPKLQAEPRIKFKIEIKQSDLPVGIISLLQKLDQNFSDGKK